jgi:hypothetical protein
MFFGHRLLIAKTAQFKVFYHKMMLKIYSYRSTQDPQKMMRGPQFGHD